MKKDIRAECFALWKKQAEEKEIKWRRDNIGKVRFYLKMAPDDVSTFSKDGQTDLQKVISALRKHQIAFDAPAMIVDSIDAVSGYVGEIITLLEGLSPVVLGAFTLWIKSKPGRKVKLKDGDIEIEAQTTKEVLKMLEKLNEIKAKNNEPL